MPKGIPYKRYTGEFKQHVVETMHREKLSYGETQRQFEIGDNNSVQRWERIYLEEGAEGLYVERRGRSLCCQWDTKGSVNWSKKRGRRRSHCRSTTTKSGECLPKKFTSLGVGQRATATEKTVVVTKLRREFPLALMLDIAELPRATYYYHVRNGNLLYTIRPIREVIDRFNALLIR